MPDHEARLAALEEQLGQLTEACATRRRLDEHAGHIDETVVDAFFLLVGSRLASVCKSHISSALLPTHWSIFAQVGVFSMQQGFAMLEVGSCAKDHTKEILLKNV